MIPFKNQYVLSMVKNLISRHVSDATSIDGTATPTYEDILYAANIKFDFFSNQTKYSSFRNMVTNPPYVTKELFDDIINDFSLYANSLFDTPILNEYIQTTLKYTKITQRFLYSNLLLNNIVNELSNYSCRHIDIVSDATTELNSTFNIGNYIVLPFCINNVKCYNGPVSISTSPLEEVKFDNFSDISTLPPSMPVLVKYLTVTGTNRNTISLSCKINQFTTNMIYINTYGDIESIRIDAYNGGILYLSDTIESSEALFTFDPITIDNLIITVTVSNFNLNKQVAFEISELLLFSDVKFSTLATFETNPIEIVDFLNINKLRINAINFSKNPEVGFDKYISMTFSDSVKNFFQIDDITGTFLPTIKYTFTNKYALDGGAIQYIITAKTATTNSDISATFYAYDIDSNVEGTMNFKQAKVLIGTNDAYGTSASPASENGKLFENWTKIDNYYRTMLLNNEENVFIDIGLNQIKINNALMTGIISIPVGISIIDVHESLFDPTFGADIDPSSVNGLSTNDYIYGDRLYPYNFAYKLAGLPRYDINGGLDIETMDDVVVSGIGIVHLNTPFIPLTIDIHGLGATTYSLHLGNIPVNPGTFTIEPNRGIVRVHAFMNMDGDYSDTISISYTKASSEIKPCGILFNRQATYIDYKSIYNMLTILGTYDSTFFSYYKTDSSEILLIPSVAASNYDYLTVYHNKIMYNVYENNLFASTRFTLRTGNSNVSPAIKNIFIQGYR
jgi:hypothetical protein